MGRQTRLTNRRTFISKRDGKGKVLAILLDCYGGGPTKYSGCVERTREKHLARNPQGSPVSNDVHTIEKFS